MRRNKRHMVLAAAVAVGVSTVSSQAALVMYEPFQGYTTGALDAGSLDASAGQAPNANTIGLNQTYVYTSRGQQ